MIRRQAGFGSEWDILTCFVKGGPSFRVLLRKGGDSTTPNVVGVGFSLRSARTSNIEVIENHIGPFDRLRQALSLSKGVLVPNTAKLLDSQKTLVNEG